MSRCMSLKLRLLTAKAWQLTCDFSLEGSVPDTMISEKGYWHGLHFPIAGLDWTKHRWLRVHFFLTESVAVNNQLRLLYYPDKGGFRLQEEPLCRKAG